MKRWLADFRVESEISLSEGQKKLIHVHPSGLFEIHINDALDDLHFKKNLAIQVIFSAENIKNAEEMSKTYLHQFLNTLSLISCTGYKYSRTVHLTEWTAGLSMREMYVYSEKLAKSPAKVLTDDLLNSVGLLQKSQSMPVVTTALRWFANGVRSTLMEDQFQYFWYVIELIAIAKKSSEKVADQCQKCRGDLYCKECGEISVHKPFEKQAIEKLFKTLGLEDGYILDLFEIRNSLMHAATREEIDANIKARHPEFQFSKGVDLLGRAARDAIFKMFILPDGEHDVALFNVSTFVDYNIIGKAHMIMGVGGDPNNPQVENVLLPKIAFTPGPSQDQHQASSGGKNGGTAAKPL